VSFIVNNSKKSTIVGSSKNNSVHKGHDTKTQKMNAESNMGIIIFPYHKGSQPILSNLIDIASDISRILYVVTGNIEGVGLQYKSRVGTIYHYNIEHHGGSNIFTRIIKYTITQIKLSFIMITSARSAKVWLFFLGGENLILPMFVAKLLGKKIILILGGSSVKIAEASKDLLVIVLSCVFRGTCLLANRIVVYSPNIVKIWNLENYENKILIAHRHFLDFEKFKSIKDLCERDNIIGYIGRLSEEKGIVEFTKAIPLILKEKWDLNFIIGGDGQLREEIEKFIAENNLNNKVKVIDWIPHDKLPDHLNELKLLVLPSYTEGLPNIMLEAMACGTPVLATAVGAIPDIIKDGEVGFIMENNSPECIAKNIIRTLNYPNLEKIAENGRKLVKKEFTFEKTIDRWKKVIERIEGRI